MAKRVPGKPFKKGKSGNPDGRPPLPPDVKALRSVTNDTIKEVMDLLLDKDIAAIEELAESETEPSLKVLYAAGVLRAIKEGNPAHLEPVLNRVLGRPKESVELSGKDGGPIETKSEFVIALEERIKQVEKK